MRRDPEHKTLSRADADVQEHPPCLDSHGVLFRSRVSGRCLRAHGRFVAHAFERSRHIDVWIQPVPGSPVVLSETQYEDP
jgi:hypothetical protein